MTASLKDFNILIVEDDSLMREFLEETLLRAGYKAESVGSGPEGLDRIRNSSYDLILTDIKMGEVGGMEILVEAKRQLPDCKIIMMTAYGTIENAVEAMKLGAFDYLTKPFSADAIEVVVDKAWEYHSLLLENRRLKSELVDRYSFRNIIGKTSRIQEIFELIRTVAPTSSTVLITGQSGTGKELIAKAIHYHSDRREEPFIKVNCPALPETLIESELFGHIKGSYTGAIETRSGRFEDANKGTLLLDEISEMSIGVQAKLLRVLQEGEFQRIGSGKTIRTDVRVIATTNRDLRRAIKKGSFREDLFYRLNVVRVHLPTLRERKADIPLLVNHFLEKFCSQTGKSIAGVSETVMEAFYSYHWAGNVRELENFIESAVVLARKDKEVLEIEDFPPELITFSPESGEEVLKPGQSLDEVEKLLILKTLEANRGNRSRTAKVLGISTRTLRNKLAEYGLKKDSYYQPKLSI